MSDLNVARRYAEAMIDVASELGRTDPIAHELWLVESALHANDDQLFAVMSSPVFTTEEREAVLRAVLPKVGVSAEVGNFALLLSRNGRIRVFDLVREHYNRLADDRAGRVRARVTTAEPLSPQFEIEIKAALEASTGKTVYIEHDIDPSLIGGMVARVGGKVYDSSIRTRLDQLRRTLVAAEA
ncbi:MAG: ATP synthase F1 subunit delta [Alphaproteobacteria bacterium]|nr:ATP synthase F1 subunit delta [Alphaproteobacteria bacterium]